MKGNMDGIRSCYWIKVRYDSTSKLDPLRYFYGENIRLLKLKAGGSLVEYIERLYSLGILWQEIEKNVDPEDRIVTKMVEQIEYPLYSVPCESIKNWDSIKCTFCDATATLWAHETIQMTGQNKIAIDDEVNILLLGKFSNKRRETG